MAFSHLTMVKNHSCHTLAWSHSMIVPASLLWDCRWDAAGWSTGRSPQIWLDTNPYHHSLSLQGIYQNLNMRLFCISLFTEMKAEMNIWMKLNDVHHTWFGLVTRIVIIILINTYCVKVFLTVSHGLSNQLCGFQSVNLLTVCHPHDLQQERWGVSHTMASSLGMLKEG